MVHTLMSLNHFAWMVTSPSLHMSILMIRVFIGTLHPLRVGKEGAPQIFIKDRSKESRTLEDDHRMCILFGIVKTSHPLSKRCLEGMLLDKLRPLVWNGVSQAFNCFAFHMVHLNFGVISSAQRNWLFTKSRMFRKVCLYYHPLVTLSF